MTTNDSEFFVGSFPEAVPDGTYEAVLTSAEATETRFGMRRRWVFRLPTMDDTEVSQLTSLTFDGDSRGNEIVAALIGSRLAPGEVMARDELIGRRCILIVSTTYKVRNVIHVIQHDGARRLTSEPDATAHHDMSRLD